jgi:Flp pilus assembly pilin Flp
MLRRLLDKRFVLALQRDRRGAVAVEFGLVAAPFFFLVLGIIELGLVLLTSGMLDTATAEAARESGMAGRAVTPASVAERICAGLPRFGRDCDSVLAVRLDERGAIGGAGGIVVVSATYRWPLLSPLLGRALPAGDGSIALVATNAFRLERS